MDRWAAADGLAVTAKDCRNISFREAATQLPVGSLLSGAADNLAYVHSVPLTKAS